MSAAVSPSTGRQYGIQRVCRMWEIPRSTLYYQRRLRLVSREPQKRGPRHSCLDDAALLEAILQSLASSPWQGEGHRKVWARRVPNALSWTGAADPAAWTEVERYTLDAVLARQQTERQTFGGSPATTAYAQNAAHYTTQVGAESRTVHEGLLNGDGTFYYRWDA